MLPPYIPSCDTEIVVSVLLEPTDAVVINLFPSSSPYILTLSPEVSPLI